ncbi:MAG TPA: hypothetical protein DCP92_01140, partial [Nitrospiraceae bacterium]|nr:hypothetical protein [Nitrospiraceae bacterium]
YDFCKSLKWKLLQPAPGLRKVPPAISFRLQKAPAHIDTCLCSCYVIAMPKKQIPIRKTKKSTG